MQDPQTHPSNPIRRQAGWGWLVAVLLVLVAWGGAFALRGGGEKAIIDGWNDGFDTGQAQAEQVDRPMIVLFTASWCGPCQQLKRDVLNQPETKAALAEGFVAVQVDLSDRSSANPNLEVAQRYGVRDIPTVIAMWPNGETIARFVGEPTPDDFVAWLDSIE